MAGLLIVGGLVVVGCSDSESASDTTGAPAAPTTAAPAAATTEPASTEPISSEPISTEPASTEPASTEPASTEPASTEPEETTPPTDDAALAASALLQPEDFPEGWVEEPYDPVEDEADDATDDARAATLAECLGVDPLLLSDEVMGDTRATSSTFESPDGAHAAEQRIGFASDEETAEAALLAIGDPNLPECYEQNMREAFDSGDPAQSVPEGLTLMSLTMEPLDLTGLSESDEAVWWVVTAELDYNGDALTQYLDLVFLREGRVLSQVELTGINSEFPDDLDGPVVQRVLELMEGISGAST